MSALDLSLAWIARAAHGTLQGADRAAVGRVVTDTRTLAPGDVFVALSGPKYDGHDFVPTAFERGAAAAVVSRKWAADHESMRPLVAVDDPLMALQALAHDVRRAVPSRVVAITGSAGKTTTKELTAAALATRYSVIKNQGNLNNHIGLPLSLLELRSAPDLAVMELGMNHAGEIRRLVEIAEPDVRVWTNVGDAHLGFFESSDAIADAKAEILEQAGERTLLVCASDDSRITARRGGFPGRTVTFGASEAASVRAVDIVDRGVDGVDATVLTSHGEARFSTPLLGRANLLNVLAATAVAIECGVPLEAVRLAVAGVGPAERRGVVRKLRDGIVLVDDSYNSSPAALRQALATVAASATSGGRVAVVGEMLELGRHADVLHAECGRVAAASGLRALVAVGGPPAQHLAAAAVASGMAREDVRYFETSVDAAPDVVRLLQPGDLLLVKGSRGTQCDVVADRVVEAHG